MKIILLGAPGSGKGTQAEKLERQLRIPRISTGEMFRREVISDTSLGRSMQKVLSSGGLVEDGLVLDLLQKRLEQDDCQLGFLLDGFPRTIAQAEALGRLGIAIDLVIELKVEDAAIIQRLSGRRIHPASGRTYHVVFNPPVEANKDNLTGEELTLREDDQEVTILRRLDLYYQQTEPLVAWFKQRAVPCHAVPAEGAVDGVTERILKALE